MLKDDLRKEIIKKLTSEDTVDKMYGIEDIRDLFTDGPPDDEMLDYLMTFLKSEEVILQETAGRVLGHYPYAIVAKRLVPFLDDPSIELRNAVNLVFHNLGNKKEVFDELLPYLHDKDEDIVIFVLDILIQIGDESCFEPVCTTISEKNENIVLKAYEVLGSMGGPQAEAFLVEQSKRDDLDIIQIGTIILQLSKFKNLKYENYILDYQKENDALLSLKCKSIGGFGEKYSTTFLLELLKKFPKKTSLVSFALEALGKISKSHPKDFQTWIDKDFDLMSYLDCGKPKIQKHAITILGVLKTDHYIDKLITFLKENNKALKENALDALADDNTSKAESIIRLMQYDSNQEVAMKARLIIQTKTLESQ
jgi:HEAT repeat protein